uniref:Uncharacterized protein n=1 Tax=Anguilla anguilla TaxID=7936 RepID=A0A0E9PHH7_ANGAN
MCYGARRPSGYCLANIGPWDSC